MICDPTTGEYSIDSCEAGQECCGGNCVSNQCNAANCETWVGDLSGLGGSAVCKCVGCAEETYCYGGDAASHTGSYRCCPNVAPEDPEQCLTEICLYDNQNSSSNGCPYRCSKCKEGETCCSGTCCTSEQYCFTEPASGMKSCCDKVKEDLSKCLVVFDEDPHSCPELRSTCKEGETCVNGTCCKGSNICGNNCCTDGQECCGGACVTKCDASKCEVCNANSKSCEKDVNNCKNCKNEWIAADCYESQSFDCLGTCYVGSYRAESYYFTGINSCSGTDYQNSNVNRLATVIGRECCPAGQEVCGPKTGEQTQVCCELGKLCKDSSKALCCNEEAEVCGDICCEDGAECADASISKCCTVNEVACGTTCCPMERGCNEAEDGCACPEETPNECGEACCPGACNDAGDGCCEGTTCGEECCENGCNSAGTKCACPEERPNECGEACCPGACNEAGDGCDLCDGVVCEDCEECNPENGQCESTCTSEQECCGGTCITKCDISNCEACNNGSCQSTCGQGEVCNNGTCEPDNPCEEGQISCGSGDNTWCCDASNTCGSSQGQCCKDGHCCENGAASYDVWGDWGGGSPACCPAGGTLYCPGIYTLDGWCDEYRCCQGTPFIAGISGDEIIEWDEQGNGHKVGFRAEFFAEHCCLGEVYYKGKDPETGEYDIYGCNGRNCYINDCY